MRRKEQETEALVQSNYSRRKPSRFLNFALAGLVNIGLLAACGSEPSRAYTPTTPTPGTTNNYQLAELEEGIRFIRIYFAECALENPREVLRDMLARNDHYKRRVVVDGTPGEQHFDGIHQILLNDMQRQAAILRDQSLGDRDLAIRLSNIKMAVGDVASVASFASTDKKVGQEVASLAGCYYATRATLLYPYYKQELTSPQPTRVPLSQRAF